MHALSTLDLRRGPEHARAICLTFIAPFIKHLSKLAKLRETNNKLVPRIQSGHLRYSDNSGQEKVRRKSSLSPSLTKQSLLGS